MVTRLLTSRSDPLLFDSGVTGWHRLSALYGPRMCRKPMTQNVEGLGLELVRYSRPRLSYFMVANRRAARGIANEYAVPVSLVKQASSARGR